MLTELIVAVPDVLNPAIVNTLAAGLAALHEPRGNLNRILPWVFSAAFVVSFLAVFVCSGYSPSPASITNPGRADRNVVDVRPGRQRSLVDADHSTNHLPGVRRCSAGDGQPVACLVGEQMRRLSDESDCDSRTLSRRTPRP